MKKSVNVILIFALLLVTAVAISGCSQYSTNQGSKQVSAAIAPPEAPAAPPAARAAANTIKITASGFSPNTLTIKAGDTLTFVNRDAAQHWPASAVHPTHAVYPEPGGCIGSKFDACKGLATGETFQFTFTHAGRWKYHDHLNPSSTGTIVVQ